MAKRPKKTIQARITDLEVEQYRLDRLHAVSSDALWKENFSTKQALTSINQRFDQLERKVDFIDQKFAARMDFMEAKMIALFKGLEQRLGKIVAEELRKHKK